MVSYLDLIGLDLKGKGRSVVKKFIEDLQIDVISHDEMSSRRGCICVILAKHENSKSRTVCMTRDEKLTPHSLLLAHKSHEIVNESS